MALQASGTIKYSQIIAEFGTPNNGGLGEFRLGGGENVGSLSNLPLDDGVPVSGQSDTGVIAQQVDALGLPGITTTRSDGTMAVRYDRLIPLLIEAIKELEARVKTLEG